MVQLIARSQYDERLPFPSDLNFEGDKGVTKQSDLKESDINYIMNRFERTGQLPGMIVREPHYGDFTSVPDYQEALSIVNLATEQFNNLDATLRNRFENDPAKFLEFVDDSKNIDEVEKMGLLKPEIVAARKAARKAAFDAREAEAKIESDKRDKAFIEKIKADLNKTA